MLTSFALILTGAIGSAFGPQECFGFLISYTIYSLSRFLIAVGTRGINETGYVLALELVGSKNRNRAAIGFEHFFSIGQFLLVTMSYFVRDCTLNVNNLVSFSSITELNMNIEHMLSVFLKIVLDI